MERWQGASTHVTAVTERLSRTDDVVVLVPSPGRRRTTGRRLWDALALQFRAVRRCRHVDVMYLRHHPLLLPLALLARWWDVPTIQEVNGPVYDISAVYPASAPFAGALRRITVASLKASSRVIAVSWRLRDYLISLGVSADHIGVVPNGADIRLFEPGPTDPDRYAMFVGALTPWQGLETLMRATREPGWPQGLRLLVVGDGPLRTSLTKGDADVVEDRGPLPNHVVARLMAGAVLTISPKTEAALWSSPLKVYESVACGVPLVVTDVGEQGDLVRDLGCGLVVPARDPGAMADAVRSIATDTGVRRDMAAAAINGRSQYSWEASVAKTRKVMVELCAHRRSVPRFGRRERR